MHQAAARVHSATQNPAEACLCHVPAPRFLAVKEGAEQRSAAGGGCSPQPALALLRAPAAGSKATECAVRGHQWEEKARLCSFSSLSLAFTHHLRSPADTANVMSLILQGSFQSLPRAPARGWHRNSPACHGGLGAGGPGAAARVSPGTSAPRTCTPHPLSTPSFT